MTDRLSDERLKAIRRRIVTARVMLDYVNVPAHLLRDTLRDWMQMYAEDVADLVMALESESAELRALQRVREGEA